MNKGDILLLMTDGVLDGLHADDDELGLRTLEALVAAAPADVAEINARVLAEVAPRRSGLVDDITLVRSSCASDDELVQLTLSGCEAR